MSIEVSLEAKTNAIDGFFGLSSPFGGFSRGGFCPGLMTGGGSFGGGFFWSSFWADIAIESPITATKANINCLKVFILVIIVLMLIQFTLHLECILLKGLVILTLSII